MREGGRREERDTHKLIHIRKCTYSYTYMYIHAELMLRVSALFFQVFYNTFRTTVTEGGKRCWKIIEARLFFLKFFFVCVVFVSECW